MTPRATFAVLTLPCAVALAACPDDAAPSPSSGAPDAATSDATTANTDTPDVSAPSPTRTRFAFAEADLPMPEGTVLGGYGVPGGNRVPTGVHDAPRLQVALMANDAGQAFLLASVDASGWFHELRDWGPGLREARADTAAALAQAHPDLGLTADAIVVSSSHSHAAPDLAGFYAAIGEGPAVALLEQANALLVTLALEAADTLVPAQLLVGSGELTGYSSRDQSCCEALDTEVTILQAREGDDGSGPPLATLVNWAKHPTVLPQSNTLASADFVGPFRDRLAAETGAPAMYLQGFVAAVHGRHSYSSPDSQWANVTEVGHALADATLAALPSLAPPPADEPNGLQHGHDHRATVYGCLADTPALTTIFEAVDMPKRTVDVTDEGYVVAEIPVSWHRVGPLELVAMPGEPSPAYSLMAKALMTRPGRFTVGLSNDAIGYILEPGEVAADTTGQLMGYEVNIGLGLPHGPCAWDALLGLGWSDAAE